MPLQHPENLPPNQLLAAVDGAVFIQVDGKTAALIDRLVHYCHLVTIRGNSYRMGQHTDLWQTLRANQEPEPAASRRQRVRQQATTN